MSNPEEVILESSNKRSAHPVVDVVAGSIGGMVGLMVGSPFDVIKVRMQSQTNPNEKLGIVSTVRQAWKHEGITAFYKGLLPPLLAEGVLNSVWFGTYASVCYWLNPDPNKQISLFQISIAGACAGFTGSFVLTPFDLVKVRAQINRGVGAQRKRPKQIVKEIYQEEGFRGFSRGFLGTISRDVPSMAVYFCLYNYLKRSATNSDGYLSPLAQFMTGGVAGTICWGICYPADVIKTRMQSSNRFNGLSDCVRTILRTEGVGSFWHGVVPCLLRAFPVNATIFFVYEFIIRLSWANSYSS
eukprot:TRINITY_DN3091_c0_g1_i2.p1 TRINITY_DN3091_c0_g1~~TRINITY_DN3091_c0_g1_i2.p1  ORF type:complete len:299 (+),score=57.22 TRINITY_DN3091_c0_g1_i2:109-1005(+)